jgi:hypothetical protein
VRNLEKNSTARQNAKDLFENSLLSNREIAKEVSVSEKTIRNWVDQGKWERKSANASADVRSRGQFEEAAAAVPSRAAADIAREFCGTVDILRAELDTAVRNLRLIQEIAEADIDDDGDKASEARRRLLAKVLDLPSLVKSANDLAAALSRLKDVGPGKKEKRQNDADQSASSDRYAVPAPPPRLMQ